MHSAFNLILVLDFLLVAKVSLLHLKLIVLVGALLPEAIGGASSKPGSYVALDFESDGLTLLIPHGRGHILSRVDDLVVALVNIEAGLLHLDAKFAHHLRRLRLVLVSLHLTLDLIRVEVPCLVSLSEGMVVCDARAVISEAAKVWFGPLLFLDGDRHDFDLVIGEADLNFELVWHNEFISLNRIIVVLLLLSHLVTLLHHLLLLQLLYSHKILQD